MPGRRIKRFKLDYNVSLPEGLTPEMVARAVRYIEREASKMVDIYFDQQNVFSAIVGICGIRALDHLSPYERNPHRYESQQRFPDLRRRGSHHPPPPEHCLESKASIRPWVLQSHYDHPGWYIVWRYLVDPTLTFEKTPVVIWRVDVAFLRQTDWKYEHSSAGPSGGGRTHTFGVKNPKKVFQDKAVYLRTDVKLAKGKPVPANGGT